MKAVIFAGGLGTRMGSETLDKPKPMLDVGNKPMLWHIMAQLSSQGISEFLVLGGYKCEVIVNYFDSALRLGDSAHFDFSTSSITPLSKSKDWKVSVLETGLTSETARRLFLARQLIGDETFLCTYGDGLANIDLSSLKKQHEYSRSEITISVARARSRFGQVVINDEGVVKSFSQKPELSDWVNIGFMLIERAALDSLGSSSSGAIEEELLIPVSERGKLSAYVHRGEFMPVDTARELREATRLVENGQAFWLDD